MKSVIECRYEVGDAVFCTHQLVVHNTEEQAIDSVAQEAAMLDQPEGRIFPSIRMRVDSIRLRQFVDGELIEVVSALERIYKVMRNRSTMSIALLTMDMGEVVKIEWPESKPFHDALGPIDNGQFDGFAQVMYVVALNVDGNYKLIEVLNDQDW